MKIKAIPYFAQNAKKMGGYYVQKKYDKTSHAQYGKSYSMLHTGTCPGGI